MSLQGKLAKLGIIPAGGVGSGDVYVGDDLTVAGLATIGETLAVTGLTTLNDGIVDVDETSMAPSSVITATVASYVASVVRTGSIIKTTIKIDLTGAKSITTNKDIIGDTGVCYIGQVTAAVNGNIFAGQVSCAEVPTTGDDDIDLYASSDDDGAFDGDASALTGAQVLMAAGAALAVGTVHPFTVLPTDDFYLYLTTGGTTAGTYDAGIIIIEMWGSV